MDPWGSSGDLGLCVQLHTFILGPRLRAALLSSVLYHLQQIAKIALTVVSQLDKHGEMQVADFSAQVWK